MRHASPRTDFTATAAGDRITVRGALQDNGLRFEAQIRLRTQGGAITTGADGSLTVTGADSAWFAGPWRRHRRHHLARRRGPTHRAHRPPLR
ncbi:hypothetical protein [Streptomyces sp. H27-C3]|uniref:hypothetical protein n=1 Tax=Streptomyces sp. H27-C3 TaxID=3046305 RepID=UPI0032D9695E